MLRLPLHALVLTMATGPGVGGCAASRALGQPAAPSPAAPHVVITGMVVNGVTARPLPGAVIDLDDRRALTESGPDGRFHIDDIPVGFHLLGARALRFRSRLQPVNIVLPDPDPDVGRRNDFIVLLFAPSGYFASFPSIGTTHPCRSEVDCPPRQICLMTNFKEGDAPACTPPVPCRVEPDCKLGQQCEPVTLLSGEELRVCQGQPAPEAEP